jgi:hypothetical protein
VRTTLERAAGPERTTVLSRPEGCACHILRTVTRERTDSDSEPSNPRTSDDEGLCRDEEADGQSRKENEISIPLRSGDDKDNCEEKSLPGSTCHHHVDKVETCAQHTLQGREHLHECADTHVHLCAGRGKRQKRQRLQVYMEMESCLSGLEHESHHLRFAMDREDDGLSLTITNQSGLDS